MPSRTVLILEQPFPSWYTADNSDFLFRNHACTHNVWTFQIRPPAFTYSLICYLLSMSFFFFRETEILNFFFTQKVKLRAILADKPVKRCTIGALFSRELTSISWVLIRSAVQNYSKIYIEGKKNNFVFSSIFG